MTDKKVIVANYRYYVSGGPEVYMFKFMERCGDIGYAPIPFSVKYSKNEPTEYEKYFISSRGGDSVYYDQIKKTPKAIYKTLQGAFYNKEAVKKIDQLIDDEHPQVLYALQVINTLSPSIFKAAKKRGLKVIHRVSDFNLVCPASTLLRKGFVCDLCLSGNLKYSMKNKCCHDSTLATLLRMESMQYHRKKKLYEYVDYFVTPTSFTRDKLIEGGFPSEKIIKVPTFIDSSSIIPNFKNQKYVLFLGRLSPEKGAIYAISAMKYLKGYGIKLKVTGTLGDADKAIRSILAEEKLTECVEFVGFQRGQALADLISNCLCVLCPAVWYDNMPNTVIEAYSYGKPVIASNIGCFPELIEDEITGYLFEPGNSFQLAEKIKVLLRGNCAEILGRNARRKVEVDFAPKEHFEALQNLFNN